MDFTLSVSETFLKDKENNVPVITGWNADESFVDKIKNKEVFKQEAKDQYGPNADQFLKYYPANTDEEAARSQVKLSRDMIFALSGFKWAGIQSAKGKSPVYVYYFARKLPATLNRQTWRFATGVVRMMDNPILNRPWEKEHIERL
jgi:para-nitrobenzyl esterase